MREQSTFFRGSTRRAPLRRGRRALDRRDEVLTRLAETGRALADTPEGEDPLQHLALLVARRWADACVIHLVDPTGGAPTAVAVACDPEQLTELLGALQGVAAEVLRTREPVVAAASDLGRLAQGDAARGHVAALGPRSCISVPLRVQATTLGVLTLVHRAHRPALGPRDLHPVELLALQVVSALERPPRVDPPGELLHVVAHDVRNALGALILASEYIERALSAPQPPPAAHDAVAMLRRSVNQIQQGMNDALDIEALSRGAAPLCPIPLAPHALVAAAIGATPGRVQIITQVSDALPAVAADRERAQQLFTRLIDCAARSARGGERILVAAEACPTGVCFRIGPEGGGPREITSSTPAPTKLTLAFVRTLVEAHRGRFWSEGDAGARLTHCFTLPLA